MISEPGSCSGPCLRRSERWVEWIRFPSPAPALDVSLVRKRDPAPDAHLRDSTPTARRTRSLAAIRERSDAGGDRRGRRVPGSRSGEVGHDDRDLAGVVEADAGDLCAIDLYEGHVGDQLALVDAPGEVADPRSGSSQVGLLETWGTSPSSQTPLPATDRQASAPPPPNAARPRRPEHPGPRQPSRRSNNSPHLNAPGTCAHVTVGVAHTAVMNTRFGSGQSNPASQVSSSRSRRTPVTSTLSEAGLPRLTSAPARRWPSP